MAQDCLQFVPFSSMLDSGFWHNLSKRKLEEYKLDEHPVPIRGFYSYGTSPGLPSFANIDYSAFDCTQNSQESSIYFPMPGTLLNLNTLESFKAINKQQLLNDSGEKLWKLIVSGELLNNPQPLASFILLTFTDLKKYHFYYWFAFPAFNYPDKAKLLKEPLPIKQYFSDNQILQFQESYGKLDTKDRGFFLIQVSNEETAVKPLSNFSECLKTKDKVILGFADPSNFGSHPGWPLRNFLALVSYQGGSSCSEWDILCFREQVKDGQRNCDHSFVLSISLEQNSSIPTDPPPCVGWEKNENQKLTPRKVDLSSSMDPVKLAESAVDLNLKLMKWRLAPDVNLDIIKDLKCLLFGAGTLGCHVARCLLGWGVKHFTFVDNGRVSYSNPVRQSLFTFEDCLNGGRLKAEAAAKALQNIFPGVDSSGQCITLPMPGHFVSDSMVSQVREDVTKVEELIESHDALFLLTDTRESRWLPTLIGAAKGKIVINAALGFDTFLVVRHGVKDFESPEVEKQSPGPTSLKDDIPGSDVGCYFCNDVVAPGDSTRDRTLDQQCTVTRPGVSMMAASLAAELLISMIQHPMGPKVAASTGNGDSLLKDFESPLGIVPHQIRGFMSRFYHILPATKAFERCTACSKFVLNKYTTEGFEFLLNVFNNPSYLEDITGLKKMQEETDLSEVWELSDSDSA